MLANYGGKIHLTKLRSGYAVIIEGDSFVFDKSYSPIELLQPVSFRTVTQRLLQKKKEEEEFPDESRMTDSG